MACSIIEYLEASPDFLTKDATGSAPAGDDLLDRAFHIFLSLVLSESPAIRTMATSVAGRLLEDPAVLGGLKSRGNLGSLDLRMAFWRRRSVSNMDRVLLGARVLTFKAVAFSSRCVRGHW